MAQIGRAGRGGDAANALVLLRDADMRLMHSLKHSCDCDAVSVKRILQALLDAAHTAAARDAAAEAKQVAASVPRRKRARAAGTGAAAAKATPAAKRKRRAKVTEANLEDEEPQHAGGGVRARKPPGRGRTQAADTAAPESSDGSDSESDGDSSDCDEEYAAPRRTGVQTCSVVSLP